MMINRYILKLKPSILKRAKIGDMIGSDSDHPEDQDIPAGFICNIFKKTKSIEICLFNSIDIKKLNVAKDDILYYESDYDVRSRFKEIKNIRGSK